MCKACEMFLFGLLMAGGNLLCTWGIITSSSANITNHKKDRWGWEGHDAEGQHRDLDRDAGWVFVVLFTTIRGDREKRGVCSLFLASAASDKCDTKQRLQGLYRWSCPVYFPSMTALRRDKPLLCTELYSYLLVQVTHVKNWEFCVYIHRHIYIFSLYI